MNLNLNTKQLPTVRRVFIVEDENWLAEFCELSDSASDAKKERVQGRLVYVTVDLNLVASAILPSLERMEECGSRFFLCGNSQKDRDLRHRVDESPRAL